MSETKKEVAQEVPVQEQLNKNEFELTKQNAYKKALSSLEKFTSQDNIEFLKATIARAKDLLCL